MSNLLPEKNKEENRRRFFYRELAVMTAMISVLIFISCILLVAIYIYLSFGDAGKKDYGKTLIELSANDQILVKDAQEINKKLKILLPDEDAVSPSAVVVALFDGQREGINLHHLAMECQGVTKVCTVAVLGRTKERQDLLDYVADLRRSELFKSVESPINNLISDKDSQFSLELETNPIKDLLD